MNFTPGIGTRPEMTGNSREIWVDYYKVLGISDDATAKEISSAYRSLALKHHPDKSSSPESAVKFHALSKAYQVLTDTEARRAFDALLTSRQAQQQRELELDVARREMRDDLLRREREARKRKAEEAEAEARMKNEMERLRREAQIEEERRKREIRRDKIGSPVPCDDLDRTLKIDADVSLTEELVSNLLQPYGDIEHIMISSRRSNGIVRMRHITAAKGIMMDYEKGLFSGIKLSWSKIEKAERTEKAEKERDRPNDFEDIILKKMKQAAEKRSRSNKES